MQPYPQKFINQGNISIFKLDSLQFIIISVMWVGVQLKVQLKDNVHMIQGWGPEEESWMAAIEQRISTGVHGKLKTSGQVVGWGEFWEGFSAAGKSHLLEITFDVHNGDE